MHETLTYRLVAILGRLFARFADGTMLPMLRGADGDPTPLADLLVQAEAIGPDTTDDELAILDADITSAAERLAEQTELTDDDLAALEAAGPAVQAIRQEAADREAAVAARAERAQAALQAVRGEQAPAGEGDGDEPEAEPAAEPESTPAPAEPVEVEVTVPTAEAEQQPIAAGAAPARRRPAITRVAARRPAQAAPRTVPTPAHGDLASMGLVAAANAPGVQAGQPITTYDGLARAFVAAVDATKGYRHGPRVKVPVVRIGNERAEQYPEGYRLDSNISANLARIEAAQRLAQESGGVRAGITASLASPGLQAAGGICAPQQVNYDLPIVGSDARPVRDQFLMRFGADRGGVRTIPPPSIDDVDAGAVEAWTELNDRNPGVDPDGVGPLVAGPATKPCLTITCPAEDETVVEAITRCLETGNFRARFFPEQVEAWMRLVGTWQARFAEQRLLATIAAGSVAVTHGQVLSSTRDILTALDRAVAIWRYNARLDPGFTIEFGAPMWFREQMRADIARQLPVGTLAETLAVADATIDQFFRTRNVDPVWFMDGEAGQRFVTQAAGVLQAWPATVKTYLAAPGAWLFLDGGTLDLGVVRDSTLNATNDVQMFAESWEGAHFHSALPSWTLTLTSCPDGSVSATTAVDTCP